MISARTAIQLSLIEDLSPLIAELQALKIDLSLGWQDLEPWLDEVEDPLTMDKDSLELLIERLSAIVSNKEPKK